MPAHPTPEAKLRRAVEIVEEVYRDGYQPNAVGTMQEAIRRAKGEGLITDRSGIM